MGPQTSIFEKNFWVRGQKKLCYPEIQAERGSPGHWDNILFSSAEQL